VIRLCKLFPDYNIVNMDKVDYCSCTKNLEEIEECANYKFVQGDILSSDLVMYVLAENNIDTIMHFAAQTHVDNSFGNSFQFTDNNIMGTHVLLECAKNFGKIRRFIHVSTDEVYGEGKTFDTKPMFEDEVLEPTNPYAATKAGAEFMAKSFHRSFNLPIIITRGNNVYGPHQYPEKLIPKFTNQLMRGRAVTIHGNGGNTRNFLYVTDVANAFICILHKARVGEIYNIGGRNERSVKEVADELISLVCPNQEKDALITFVPDRCFNDLRYTINSDKLEELGWREEVTWEDGIRETVDWYRYKAVDGRYGDFEQALVAHPRAGLRK